MLHVMSCVVLIFLSLAWIGISIWAGRTARELEFAFRGGKRMKQTKRISYLLVECYLVRLSLDHARITMRAIDIIFRSDIESLAYHMIY